MLMFVTRKDLKKEFRDPLRLIKLGLLRGVFEFEKSKEARCKEEVGITETNLDLSSMDTDEISSNVFAEQLTYYVHSLFCDLGDEDLYQGDKAEKVQRMIKFWNELSEWSVHFLNSSSVVDESITRLRRLLAIAKHCLDLANYDSAFAIGLALDVAKIPKSVMEGVGRVHQEIIDSLNFITSVSRGFSNYRQIMENVSPPAIPYLAISLKDIVLIRENDNYIDNTEMLNYKKLVILGSRWRFCSRYRKIPYRIAPVPRMQKYFKNLSSNGMIKIAKQTAAVQPQSMGPVSEQKSIGGKFLQLKKSVMTGASNLSFFTPREGSSSSLMVDLKKEKDKTESRRPFTARSSSTLRKKVSPREADESSSSSPAMEEGGTLHSPSMSNRWSRALPQETLSRSSTPDDIKISRKGKLRSLFILKLVLTTLERLFGR